MAAPVLAAVGAAVLAVAVLVLLLGGVAWLLLEGRRP